MLRFLRNQSCQYLQWFKLLIYADGYVAETVRFQIALQLYRLRYMFEHILCIHSLYNVLLY